MKTLFKGAELMAPVAAGLVMWLWLRDVSIAFAAGYMILLIVVVHQKWPKKEWVAGHIPEAAATVRGEEEIHLTHPCSGQPGQLEDWLVKVYELGKQQALKSYMQACFWKDETKGVLNDINNTLLRTIIAAILISFATIAVTIALQTRQATGPAEKTAATDSSQPARVADASSAEARLTTVVKILGAWVAPAVQISSLAAVCLHLRKRNSVV